MSKYKNPENYKEIVEKIKECPTLLEVTGLLNKVFPDWIQGGYKKFSTDYNYLQQNWNDVCRKIDVSPRVILNVGDYLEDEDHTLIRTFAEIFTTCGFCVRRNSELIGCSKCGSALLSESVYNALKPERPSVWLSECSEC